MQRTNRKILIVNSSLGSGGAERVASTLANAWSDRGDAVTLLVTYSDRGECFYRLNERVSLIYLADVAGARGKSIPTYISRFLALRNVARSEDFDVIISFLTNVNVAVLLATFGTKTPVIVSERTSPQMTKLNNIWVWLRRILYPLAARVAMLTRESMIWLKQAIPQARGVLIPNPVNYPVDGTTPFLAPQDSLAPNQKLLLSVGRLEPDKQFESLIRSFAAIASKYSDWTLVLLGEGSQREHLRAVVAALGLEGRVKMPGRAGNIADWYRRTDLYVMSSRVEGFPNTLVEAMAHGCCVIAYDSPDGRRDIIRHGSNGILVTPNGDIPQLSLEMDQLMASHTERLRLGKEATEVRERYSVERILRIWDELFHAITRTTERLGTSNQGLS